MTSFYFYGTNPSVEREMLKIQEHIAAKKVRFSVIIYKHFIFHAVKITIFFTLLIQASTTLKDAFLSVSKSGPAGIGYKMTLLKIRRKE